MSSARWVWWRGEKIKKSKNIFSKSETFLYHPKSCKKKKKHHSPCRTLGHVVQSEEQPVPAFLGFRRGSVEHTVEEIRLVSVPNFVRVNPTMVDLTVLGSATEVDDHVLRTLRIMGTQPTAEDAPTDSAMWIMNHWEGTSSKPETDLEFRVQERRTVRALRGDCKAAFASLDELREMDDAVARTAVVRKRRRHIDHNRKVARVERLMMLRELHQG